MLHVSGASSDNGNDAYYKVMGNGNMDVLTYMV